MLLVGNGNLLTLGNNCRVIPGGGLLINGGTISRVGKTAELKKAAPDADFFDCRGQLIMPGFSCAHIHTYSTFARGMTLKDDPPANFRQVLERLWWRLDQVLTLEDIYYSALITFTNCIKNGTTAVLDHHASPGAVSGSLEQIAAAAQVAGIRVNLCYEVSDRDGPEIAIAGLEENESFIKYCRANNSALLSANFGMHASFTIGTETIEKCARVVNDLASGVHIHVAESKEDAADCREKYKMGIVERLNKYNLLGPKTVAAHCVHIDDHEIELLAQSATNVAHNPQSNMNNAVGCAEVKKMLDRGVILGLGTDGMTTDMIEGMKTANLLHKFCQNDPRLGWKEVPQMQFANNSRIMSNFFAPPLGELAPGAAADLVVIDYDPPTPLTADNYYAHIVFGMAGSMVTGTITDGKILMQDRKLTKIEETEIKFMARELAAKLWERF